jgi:hypothetical protein
MSWGHNDLMVSASAQGFPVGATAVSSYTTDWNQQEHVVYIDGRGRIHELFYLGGSNWGHNDLLASAKASGPLALPLSIAGTASSWNQQQEIYYIGTNGHVCEFIYDGSNWKLYDLGTATSGDLGFPANQTPLSSHVTTYNEQTHVIYTHATADVREIFNDGHWYPRDVSALAQISSLGLLGPLGITSYITPWNQQQHIVLREVGASNVAGRIIELYFTDHWGWNKLGAAHSLQNPMLHGFVTPWNRQEHVVYVDSQGHVQELYYLGSGSWHDNDLTNQAHAAVAARDAITGYATPWNSQEHVNYLDAQGHIHELYYLGSGSWQPNDLSVLAKATAFPAARNVLCGYVTSWNSQQHVNYVDAQGHIHELFYTD